MRFTHKRFVFARWLWPRGRLDIGWRDLAFAAFAPLLPGTRPRRLWPTRTPHLVVLSVRTAWDALLAVQKWPVGSEVILSEANIPDMVRIIEAHGLVPVAVPLDPCTLQISIEDMQAALTERTRAILVSPLFGSRMELSAVALAAQEHGALLVEDNAQGFSDTSYQGSPDADVSLFSFGLIKTRTALSGAVVFARDKHLLEALARHVNLYPRVSARHFYVRLGRAVLLQTFSHPILFGTFWRLLERCGYDPDLWLSNATRGMSGSHFLRALRRQPHTATLKLLRRRLCNREDAARYERVQRGYFAIEQIPSVLGREAFYGTFWALPVQLARRDLFIERARQAGFDISFRASTLACHGDVDTPFARALNTAVFLPIGNSMPIAEWMHLISLICRYGKQMQTDKGKGARSTI